MEPYWHEKKGPFSKSKKNARSKFFVGAFRIKEPDYYSPWFFDFLLDALECDYFFVQFVQLNEYFENTSKLVQVTPFHFSLSSHKTFTQNRTRLKGLSIFFQH